MSIIFSRNTPFHVALRQYRLACEYTETEMAEILGVTLDNYVGWEAGVVPRSTNLAKLYKLLPELKTLPRFRAPVATPADLLARSSPVRSPRSSPRPRPLPTPCGRCSPCSRGTSRSTTPSASSRSFATSGSPPATLGAGQASAGFQGPSSLATSATADVR